MTQLTNDPPSFDTPEGQAFISSCFRWNDAVHQKTPRRLTIFTTLSFERGRPEVQDNTPFARVMAPFGTFEHNSPHAKIASQFHTDENDIILHKTRWSAIMGNSLEQILKAQRIDTVVISGLTLSGVVISTIYRLFDLDYNIYVIKDSVVELPVDETAVSSEVMLGMLLPKMNLKVISLDVALQALENSQDSILASIISILITAQARILGLDFDLSTLRFTRVQGMNMVYRAPARGERERPSESRYLVYPSPRRGFSTRTTLFACQDIVCDA
ncbi:Isochorismatase-like protein [Aspergillus pseudonomiae]|nr:Isochorismatase-like protein [Aspergillus pseudonomiae]